jgi:hypothetical protein
VLGESARVPHPRWAELAIIGHEAHLDAVEHPRRSAVGGSARGRPPTAFSGLGALPECARSVQAGRCNP